MTIIEIFPLHNGAHRNQSGVDFCPDGWAVVPDNLLAEWERCAPFANITSFNGTVTGITPIQPPDPEPEPVEDTVEQRVSDLEDAIIELAAIIAGEGE